MKRYDKPFYDKVESAIEDKNLRCILKETEAEIKKIVGENPFDFYTESHSQNVYEDIDELLEKRSFVLDKMFAYTDDEVQRIEAANNLLNDFRRKMNQRTVKLYRSLLSSRDEEFDDDYLVEGTMKPVVEFEPCEGDFGTVLHIENDDYYASDFAYMLYVIGCNTEVYKHCLKNIDECSTCFCPHHSPEMNDEELGFDFNRTDDNYQWEDGLLHPRINHIYFGYAFHSFHSHLHHYSLADMIRVNSYLVEAKIVCQRIRDSQGNRQREL